MVELECGLCGRSLDTHDRHVRFRLPEPVLTSSGQEKVPGLWLSHDSPETSVMMQVPAVGAFVRALLPVHLTSGDLHIRMGRCAHVDGKQTGQFDGTVLAAITHSLDRTNTPSGHQRCQEVRANC